LEDPAYYTVNIEIHFFSLQIFYLHYIVGQCKLMIKFVVFWVATSCSDVKEPCC